MKKIKLSHLKGWTKKRPFVTAGILLGIIAVVTILASNSTPDTDNAKGAQARHVETIAIADYTDATHTTLSASANNFVLRAETSGRIQTVTAHNKVTKGSVIAEIENSSQYASLLKAQGAYEAAIAGTDSNATTRVAAKTNAVRVWQNVTASAENIVRTTIDTHFSNPGGSIPGFRLESFGQAPILNEARVEIENTLVKWNTQSINISETPITPALTDLEQDIIHIEKLAKNIAALLPRQSTNEDFTESDRSAYVTAMSNALTTLTTLRSSVDEAMTRLEQAVGSNTVNANAQVKQALGTLRAAESTYEKTRIKAPFDGTITSRNVQVGDVITTGTDIAIMTPNKGAVTNTQFTLPLASVKFTPAGAYVFTVDDSTLTAHSVETGLVTADAITVTGLTGNEIIVRDVRGLKEGETVDLDTNQ